MPAIVRAQTTVAVNGVLYEVVVNGKIEYSKFIRFGKDKAHRAGGPAFVEAAREQEKAARRLLGENSP